ncbi:MAG: hypothetical protein RLZZ453_287 [Chlamydiota bacterium]|jgi:hypothetical protein
MFCHKQTEGFQIGKIRSWNPPSAVWDTPSDLSLLKEIFKQPFYYLDKGGQAYAFVSQDGKTVLKLFKMHNLRQYPWLYRCALPPFLESYKLKQLLNQKQKLERLFDSAQMAYQKLQKESALIYLSLNPSTELSSITVTLVDLLGISHTISLKDVPFALQKRGERALTLIKQALENQDLERGKQLIDQILACLKTRHDKGVGDLDPSVTRNLGFVDNTPFFIDIGGFCPLEQTISLKSSDTEPLEEWLEVRSKELSLYLKERL